MKIKDTRTPRLRDWQACLARKKGLKLARAWVKKRFPDGLIDEDTLFASLFSTVPDKITTNFPNTWVEAKRQAKKLYPKYEFDRWSFGCGWQEAVEEAVKKLRWPSSYKIKTDRK